MPRLLPLSKGEELSEENNATIGPNPSTASLTITALIQL